MRFANYFLTLFHNYTTVYFLDIIGGSMKRFTPAAFVIKQFNGIRPLARALNKTPGAIHKWSVTGTIPTSSQKAILKLAGERRIDIKPQDLVIGRQIR
jgi:hypothetical protein